MQAELNCGRRSEAAKLGAALTDSRVARQWYHANLASVAAWKITLGSRNVRVAVIDLGVDVKHPDLRDKIAPGRDFDNDGARDPSPRGDESHGTACAGLIAAAPHGEGIVGIAPHCRVTPVKVHIHRLTDWTAIFEFAGENSEVISCSWSTAPSRKLTEAIEKVATTGRRGKGIPCFFPTQNARQGGGPFVAYPACLPAAIAVGASTREDKRAPYSNYGEGLDFLAPSSGDGSTILTTLNSAKGVASDEAYGEFGETSAATAIAAGVAALMLSANPALTAYEVRQILRVTAKKIEPTVAQYSLSGWSRTHGFGRIDAAAAVAAAQAWSGGGAGSALPI